MDCAEIDRIAHSVCKEFGLECEIVTAPVPTDPHRWRLEIRRDDQPHQVSVVSLYCGSSTSPSLIRDSLKRQLNLG
jgi:hypothetical protein